MTHAQIGGQPHKACCHIGHRPGCIHCENYAITLEAEERENGRVTIRDDAG